MQKTIERYLDHVKEERNATIEVEQHVQHLKHEAAFMAKKIELLENSQRRFLGHNLGASSMEELKEIDMQLERSLKNIRARKSQLFKEEIEKLQAKEKFLVEENARLTAQCGLRARNEAQNNKEIGNHSQSTLSSEVVTELFIGPPATRIGSR